MKAYIKPFGIRLISPVGIPHKIVRSHLKEMGFSVGGDYSYIDVYPPKPTEVVKEETIEDVEDALLEETE